MIGLTSLGALLAMTLIALDKVRTGHGLDTYRTVWRVEDNWIGFIVFLVVALMTLAVASIWRLVARLHARRRGDDHADIDLL